MLLCGSTSNTAHRRFTLKCRRIRQALLSMHRHNDDWWLLTCGDCHVRCYAKNCQKRKEVCGLRSQHVDSLYLHQYAKSRRFYSCNHTTPELHFSTVGELLYPTFTNSGPLQSFKIGRKYFKGVRYKAFKDSWSGAFWKPPLVPRR